MAWLIANRAETASNLNGAVLELGQVSGRSRSLGGVAINATLGAVDSCEEGFLQEVTSKAFSGQADSAVACAVELLDHLAKRFNGCRHDEFVKDLHLRQRHGVTSLFG